MLFSVLSYIKLYDKDLFEGQADQLLPIKRSEISGSTIRNSLRYGYDLL